MGLNRNRHIRRCYLVIREQCQACKKPFRSGWMFDSFLPKRNSRVMSYCYLCKTCCPDKASTEEYVQNYIERIEAYVYKKCGGK